jgi:hypothetical protein
VDWMMRQEENQLAQKVWQRVDPIHAQSPPLVLIRYRVYHHIPAADL